MKAKAQRRRYCARAEAGGGGSSGRSEEPRFSADLQGVLVTAATTDPYRIGRAAFSALRSYADVFREAEGAVTGVGEAGEAREAGETEKGADAAAAAEGGEGAAAAGPADAASAVLPAPLAPAAAEAEGPGEVAGFDLFDAGIPLDAPLPASAAPDAPPALAESVPQGIRAEIMQLRSREGRFYRVKPGAKGTLFVGWARDPRFLSPNDAVSRLLDAAREGKVMGEISTAVPILHTAKARLEQVLRAVSLCARDVLGLRAAQSAATPSPEGTDPASQASRDEGVGGRGRDTASPVPPLPIELFLRIRNNNELSRAQLEEALPQHLESVFPGRTRVVEAYGAYLLVVCITAGNAMLGMVENKGLSEFSFSRAASGV